MPTIQFRNKNKGVKKRTILQFIEFIFSTYEPRPSVSFTLAPVRGKITAEYVAKGCEQGRLWP